MTDTPSDVAKRILAPLREIYPGGATHEKRWDTAEREIVAALRGFSVHTHKEPLPEALAEKQKQVDYWGDRCCKAEAEIERLRTECERWSELRDIDIKRLRARQMPSVDELAWTIGENMHGNSKQIAEAVLALFQKSSS